MFLFLSLCVRGRSSKHKTSVTAIVKHLNFISTYRLWPWGALHWFVCTGRSSRLLLLFFSCEQVWSYLSPVKSHREPWNILYFEVTQCTNEIQHVNMKQDMYPHSSLGPNSKCWMREEWSLWIKKYTLIGEVKGWQWTPLLLVEPVRGRLVHPLLCR